MGFSKGEPEATSKAFGLAEDVAKGLPLENPEGDLQYSSEGVN